MAAVISINKVKQKQRGVGEKENVSKEACC